ncbi:MAG: hypothetical protein RL623_538 [Actinomycetota bacterium]
MADILLIVGLSGAGRSQAADDLEDLGWFVVDNMPIALVDKVVELAETGSEGLQLALVLGTPSNQTNAIDVVQSLRDVGHRVRILYLDASTHELVRRYGATRRKHPLGSSTVSVEEAILQERHMLELVKGAADLVIDTSNLNVHQLKAQIHDLFSPVDGKDVMQLTIESFGYKHGIPLDVDLVFDVRFLPNPHWDETLRPLSGLDQPVSEFVLRQELSSEFIDRIQSLFAMLLPAYRAEGKSYLTIAIGCTGGRHRSVAIAEELGKKFVEMGQRPRVIHRDIAR